MRRVLAVLLAAALAVSLTACSSGNGKLPKADAVLSGWIADISGNTCLVAGPDSGELYTVLLTTVIYDEQQNAVDVTALRVGQDVEIGYSGQVLDSYPAQLSLPVYLQIKGQGDNLVGLYRAMLDDLWNEDKGLNADISMLGFDLSGVANLTGGEKSALIYLVSGTYDVQGVAGTFDELCEQGYIDKTNLIFPDGLLFQIETSHETEDSFTFNASKWRGGDGAYYFNDCHAVKSGDSWSYTVGSESIS